MGSPWLKAMIGVGVICRFNWGFCVARIVKVAEGDVVAPEVAVALLVTKPLSKSAWVIV
jgi:hypothetical protein